MHENLRKTKVLNFNKKKVDQIWNVNFKHLNMIYMKKREYTMRHKLNLNLNFKYNQNEEDRKYIEKHRIGL